MCVYWIYFLSIYHFETLNNEIKKNTEKGFIVTKLFTSSPGCFRTRLATKKQKEKNEENDEGIKTLA